MCWRRCKPIFVTQKIRNLDDGKPMAALFGWRHAGGATRHHCHGSRQEGTQHIEQQDRFHVGLLTLLVADDRRHHQHEDQQRRHGLQGADEQAAEQTRRLGPLGHEHRKKDTEYQTD